MRVSREQAAENRQRIVETASRLFREHGFDGGIDVVSISPSPIDASTADSSNGTGDS